MLTALALGLGLMVVAPVSSLAAPGDFSCTVDKSQVEPGETVTVTASMESGASDFVEASIFGAPSPAKQTGLGKVTYSYSEVIYATKTFSCAGIFDVNGVTQPGKLASATVTVPSPAVTCAATNSGGQADFYVGEQVSITASASGVGRLPYSTEISSGGSVIASSAGTTASVSLVLNTPGMQSWECKARPVNGSTGAPEGSATASVDVQAQPAAPVGLASLGSIQNSSGKAFQTVSWTVNNAPVGWNLVWLDSSQSQVTPPASIECGSSVTLSPQIQRGGTILEGNPVQATTNCSLAKPSLISIGRIKNGTLVYEVTFYPSVPAGTRVYAKYDLLNEKTVTDVFVGVTGAPTGAPCCQSSKLSFSISGIKPPKYIFLEVQGRLGSVTSAWSNGVTDPGEEPPLSYPPITGSQGQPITDAKPVTGDLADIQHYGGFFEAQGLPKGLTIDRATGIISGTPSSALTGSASVTVKTNRWGFLPVTAQVSMDIKPRGPQPGDLVYPNVNSPTGVLLRVKPTTNKVKGFFYAPDLCSRFPGLDIDSRTGVISGTPSMPAVGKVKVQVSSRDPGGSSGCVTAPTAASIVADATLSLRVIQGLKLSYPVTKVTAPVGQPISVVTPTSPNQANLSGITFAVTGGVLPPGLTLDAGTGVISGTPSQVGSAVHVTITATNGSQSASADIDFTTFPITGKNAPHYPDTSSPIGSQASITPSAASGWGPPYALAPGSPAGMTIDTNSGQVSWTATAPQGPRSIRIFAQSPAATPTALAPFTWTVLPSQASGRGSAAATGTGTAGATTGGTGGTSGAGSLAPCVAPAGTVYSDIHGSAGATLTVAPNRNELPPGSVFVISEGVLPVGVYLDSETGVISGTPERAGQWAIEIVATAPDGTRRVSDFAVYADDPHHASNYPNLVRGSVAMPLTITPFEINTHGSTTYRVVCGSLPTGMKLNAKTGVISGSPTRADVDPAPLRIRMTDDYGSVDSSFIFSVQDGQVPWLRYPEFSEIGRGLTTAITPTVSGMPSVASYAIEGDIPKGLTFNPRTGAITGSVRVIDERPYEPTITALDGDGVPLTSTWASIAVIKPAVPMHVKARGASKKLSKGKTQVVMKVRHPKYTKLSATVKCTSCTWKFNKRTGKLVIKAPKRKSWVSVYVTAMPKGIKARTKYAGHEWYRSWKVK